MDRPAICIALESKHSGNKMCSLVVREGTLNAGDVLVGRKTYCKVRGVFDDLENDMGSCRAGLAVEVVSLPTEIQVS